MKKKFLCLGAIVTCLGAGTVFAANHAYDQTS